MSEKPRGPIVGYTCPDCGFDTDKTHCDDCQGIIRWDYYERGGTAHCTNCEREVYGISCRKCGNTFSL